MCPTDLFKQYMLWSMFFIIHNKFLYPSISFHGYELTKISFRFSLSHCDVVFFYLFLLSVWKSPQRILFLTKKYECLVKKKSGKKKWERAKQNRKKMWVVYLTSSYYVCRLHQHSKASSFFLFVLFVTVCFFLLAVCICICFYFLYLSTCVLLPHIFVSTFLLSPSVVSFLFFCSFFSFIWFCFGCRHRRNACIVLVIVFMWCRFPRFEIWSYHSVMLAELICYTQLKQQTPTTTKQ